jgi:hypothetical protein
MMTVRAAATPGAGTGVLLAIAGDNLWQHGAGRTHD